MCRSCPQWHEDPHGWEVTINLPQNDPMICGKSQELRRAEVVQVRVRSAYGCEFLGCALDIGSHITSRMTTYEEQVYGMLASWLQTILENYSRQKPRQVQVMSSRRSTRITDQLGS